MNVRVPYLDGMHGGGMHAIERKICTRAVSADRHACIVLNGFFSDRVMATVRQTRIAVRPSRTVGT